MSHCRYRNTKEDLQDCADHINDEGLDREESNAKHQIIHLCVDILEELGYEVTHPDDV
jgi:hypothetical protein